MPPAAPPRTSRSYNTSRPENLLRKSEAKQEIASCINAVQRISSRMRFGGTHPAFRIVINRLMALRNGVDTATTTENVTQQVTRAEAYLADAEHMKTWGRGHFASFYRDMGVKPPETLYRPRLRKARAVPLEVGLDPLPLGFEDSDNGTGVVRAKDDDTATPPNINKGRTVRGGPPPVGGALLKGGNIPAAPPSDPASPEVQAIVDKAKALPADPLAFNPLAVWEEPKKEEVGTEEAGKE